jgi:GNAT superfamily N-acetyltransferase
VTHIEIRVAGADDVKRLAGLRQRWTAETRGDGDDASFEARFTQRYQAESRRRRFWLAEIDQEPVGMVNLVTFERMPRLGHHAGRWGHLGNMFVVPEHRRRGVGALLLTAVLGHASDLGLERIVLHPSEASIGFWCRFGFVAADELLVYRAAAGR